MPFNPYPGLRPFEYKEFELFFGREGQAEEVLRRLQKSHFMAVVGTSGSGKSSLVRAGLLPLLYSGLMFSAGADWRVAILRPGNTPIQNLARALVYPPDFVARPLETEINPLDITDEMKVGVVETILRRSSVGLADYIKGNNFAQKENLLIVVDQFEELFRYKERVAAASEQESQSVETEDKVAFVKLLLNAVRDENVGNVYIVITMRSDYLGDCAEFRDLPETINDGQYLIPRMTRDQMREAIEEPATMAEEPVKISELLVNRLLNDIGDNQDQLPILQHALMRTWKIWEDDGEPPEITVEHYERVGGMAKALSLHADKVYGELSEDQQFIAEKMFRCLTNVDAGNRETRRETELGEICRIIDADISQVIPVIEAFRREGRTFLMPPFEVPLEASSVIDISHESLIRNWERLNEWVLDEAKSARLYRRLADDALLHLNRQVSYWRDPALQIALDWRENSKPNAAWAERYHPAFDEAMEFLDGSEAARTLEIAKDKAQLKRLRMMIAALGVMFALSFGSAIASYYLYSQAKKSEEQSRASEEQSRRAETEADDAKVRALRSERATSDAKEVIDKRNEELNDALIKTKESEEAQKRLTEDAQKARTEAEQNAEAARTAEQNANDALEAAKRDKMIADEAKYQANEALKTAEQSLSREQRSQQALNYMERGDYKSAKDYFSELVIEYDNPANRNRQLGVWWMRHNLGTAQWKNNDLLGAHKTYIQALEGLGETVNDPNETADSADFKSTFIGTDFQKQTTTDPEIDFSKIATYRKLGQVDAELASKYAFGGGGDTYSRWARLSYEKFFGLYDRSNLDKDSLFYIEARKELGDVYLKLGGYFNSKSDYDNATNQFTKVLDRYKSDVYGKLFSGPRVGIDMWQKLAEVEVAQGQFGEASKKIKEGIDWLEANNQPLVEELYDARARIYSLRFEAAEKIEGEKEKELKSFAGGKPETELSAAEKEQKQKIEKEKDGKMQEKYKFKKLMLEFSAVAAGIRKVHQAEDLPFEPGKFEFETYSGLANAYKTINKCKKGSDVITLALQRINYTASVEKEDPNFLPEKTYDAAFFLDRTLKDKEGARKVYLDFAKQAVDEKVKQALINKDSATVFTKTFRYISAGRFLQKTEPRETTDKLFNAYLEIHKARAEVTWNLDDVTYGYRMIAEAAISRGDVDKAEGLLKEAVEYVKDFKFEKSTKKFKVQVVKTANETALREIYSAGSYVQLADFYRHTGKKSLALDLYKKALDVYERFPIFYPSSNDSIYILKHLAEMETQDDNAVRLFEQAIVKLENLEKEKNRLGRYFGTKKTAVYYRDYASMLDSLVKIKGTSDAALVKKRDDAVKEAAKNPILNEKEKEDKTVTGSCENGDDPEFGKEKPKADESN